MLTAKGLIEAKITGLQPRGGTRRTGRTRGAEFTPRAIDLHSNLPRRELAAWFQRCDTPVTCQCQTFVVTSGGISNNNEVTYLAWETDGKFEGRLASW